MLRQTASCFMRHFGSLAICTSCVVNVTNLSHSSRSPYRKGTNCSIRIFSQNELTPMYVRNNYVAKRHFVTLELLAYQLFQGLMLITAFAAMGNTYWNIRKYGRWRFRNRANMLVIASDFPTARYIGGVIGFLFWWFYAGGLWFQRNKEMNSVPGNIRIGPL